MPPKLVFPLPSSRAGRQPGRRARSRTRGLAMPPIQTLELLDILRGFSRLSSGCRLLCSGTNLD